MNYLYGDSTPSPIRSNFLEFLRDAIDFSVFVLQADCRIREGKRSIQADRENAGAQMKEIHSFVRTVLRAIDSVVPKGAPDTPRTQCATRLTAKSLHELSTSLNEVRATLARKVKESDAREAAERAACKKAMETLLAPHDPQESSNVTRLELGSSGAYAATVTGQSKLGLGWTFSLAIPDQNVWAAPLLLERLMPQIEIHAPQVSGWITKEVKVRPQRIERYVVTGLEDDGSVVRISLRAEAGGGAGFDLDVQPAAKSVRIALVGAKDGQNGPFDPQSEDVPKLLELADKLRAAAAELGRAHLVSATVGEANFESMPSFVPFVEHLITMLAPMTREIADHSVTSTELVIRRLLTDDRREEIFVTKASLREKYVPLPEALGALFLPLGLEPADQGPRREAPPDDLELLRSELPPSLPPPAPVVISIAPAGPEVTIEPSDHDEPVASLEEIIAMAEEGSTDESYAAYAALFSGSFAELRPEDQRQAIERMLSKAPTNASSAAVVDAYLSAVTRLQALVDMFDEPADYEMLGRAYLMLNDTTAANAAFTTALALEQKRDPQSDLCSNLMRLISTQ